MLFPPCLIGVVLCCCACFLCFVKRASAVSIGLFLKYRFDVCFCVLFWWGLSLVVLVFFMYTRCILGIIVVIVLCLFCVRVCFSFVLCLWFVVVLSLCCCCVVVVFVFVVFVVVDVLLVVGLIC